MKMFDAADSDQEVEPQNRVSGLHGWLDSFPRHSDSKLKMKWYQGMFRKAPQMRRIKKKHMDQMLSSVFDGQKARLRIRPSVFEPSSPAK